MSGRSVVDAAGSARLASRLVPLAPRGRGGGGGGGATERRLEGVDGARGIDGAFSRSDIVRGGEMAEEFLMEPGRRSGGGGGALKVVCWLVEGCNDDRSCVELFRLSSPMLVKRLGGICGAFGSVTGFPWRRAEGGAGASLRRSELDGEGGSGAFPTDSRSKTDSRSESWLAREGSGGRGLLRSVADRSAAVSVGIAADMGDGVDVDVR